MTVERKVLVSFTFSMVDQKILEFVSRTFTDREGVKITLFSSYLPLPEDSPDFSKALGSWPAAIGETILHNRIEKQLLEYENMLKKTKEHLVELGFLEESVDYLFQQISKDEAEQIIEIVQNGGYQVVVLGFRQSKIRRIFTKNIYQRIMTALKDVAICVIT